MDEKSIFLKSLFIKLYFESLLKHFLIFSLKIFSGSGNFFSKKTWLQLSIQVIVNLFLKAAEHAVEPNQEPISRYEGF